VAADGRPDALFEPSPALSRGGVTPTAEYLAARAALRARPPTVTGSRRSAPGGAVETAPLPHRRRRPPRGRQPGGPTGRRAGGRDARLRSADGHGWTWADTARVGNGPRAVGRVPSPLRIARAIPPGHRRAGQAHRWLARVREAALAEFRLDAAERRIALATVAARHLDVTTGTYAGGWARLATLVGCSRSTVARWLAWLRTRSLLGVVSTGRPADLTAPMALAGGHIGGLHGPDGQPVNEAAVYVPCEPDSPRAHQDPDPGLLVLDPRWHSGQLTVGVDGRSADRTRHPRAVDEPPAHSSQAPQNGRPVDETDTPMSSSGAGTQLGRACARNCTSQRPRTTPLRDGNNAAPRQHQPTAPGRPDDRPAGASCPECGPWAPTDPARTRAERLRLVHQLRRTSPDLARLSPHLLRHLLRPWLTAGWTTADLIHAIDTHPTDGPRHHSPTTGGPGSVRSPAGWLVARMRDWRHPDGTAAPSLRQRTAITRAAGLWAQPPAAAPTDEVPTATWPPVRRPPAPADPLLVARPRD